MRAIKRQLASWGLLLVMALSLSGCIQLDRSVTLNSDGTGTYVLILGFNSQLLSLAGQQTPTMMNDLGAKVKQDGGSYKEYAADGYTYWAYTRPFTSISQLNGFLTQMPQASGASGAAGSSSTSTGDTIKVSEQDGFLSKTYHVTGHISLKPANPTSGSNGALAPYLKDMRDSFAITMPGAISAHKGGVISGNTITYTVHFGEEADIDVTGGGLDMSVVGPIVAGGAGVLVVIAAVVGFLIWRSRARPRQLAPQAAYGAPAFGGPGYGAPGPAPVSPIWASSPEAPTTSMDAPVDAGQPPSPPLPE